MEEFKNPDGTYNGVAALSSISGVGQPEIKWIWDRLVQLKKDGVPKEEAKRRVTEEAKTKPWEQGNGNNKDNKT